MAKGVKELEKKLLAMPKRVEIAARKAMEKGADELVQMMRRLVPVDQGDLRESIAWTWGEAPKESVVLAESEPDARGLKITVYATDYKARWIEFGTIKMRAQPFFFPSYRTLRKRIQSRIKREVKKAIRFVGPVTQSEA
ncbi:HK97-gp10 family putative phage morphogenesis protein [Ensifer sp. ENS08]|uniref:HK97-gp10 family putative phage morphogenesis protein n=1 Tax=Ensifer sp. ENS08 TaxID=2769273 RepID=UPI00177F1A2C|nr:HK97-gp10 family putative phage morphogenesis protein [Ensifer sp. ENS08]MBD9569037.1 HK97 gp10 family phage protein [Ensifer sp. ENS08]